VKQTIAKLNAVSSINQAEADLHVPKSFFFLPGPSLRTGRVVRGRPFSFTSSTKRHLFSFLECTLLAHKVPGWELKKARQTPKASFLLNQCFRAGLLHAN